MKSNKQINKYQVVFSLQKENYYELFRVKDNNNSKYFLKLINLAKLEDLQYESIGQNVLEINILENVSHANIMSQVDSGYCVVDGQRYAFSVSDFVSGETLINKLTREKICTVYEVKNIIIGILNGLKYLHSLKEPIIHNGISPKSIMLDLSKEIPIARLMNFGHARRLNSQNLKCYMGGLSPFYMAPEMFKGLYSTITDLYAVGVLMYQMLFGILPWYIDLKNIPAKDRESAIISARKHPLPIPDLRVFELDDNLLNILSKALSQDVDERFQNAEDFLKALNGEILIKDGIYEKFNINPKNQKSDEKIDNPKKGNGFEDVAGMIELKQRFQEEVIDLIQRPEKYKKLRVKIPNGILLYGPPGCGKTFIAEKFAEELGCNYIYVHCSDVASPYIHGGQEKIAALFQQARDNAPTVLFLDELDAMITDRAKHHNVSESGEVNEFLSQLNNCGEDGVLVIGATNKPSMIDPAALRSGRLDIKIYVPAPSEEEREALFRLALKDISSTDIDYTKLANLTKGYVSKDICVLVNKAALLSAKEDKDSIDMATLLLALEKSSSELPSVSQMELEEHENIRLQFESKKTSRKPIGFRANKEE